ETAGEGSGRLATAFTLERTHRDQLATAVQDVLQLLELLIAPDRWRWSDPFCEEGQDGGIEPISLGQPASGASEVSYLAWVDHGKRQAGGGQGDSQGSFEATCCLKDDALWLHCLQALDEDGQPRLVIGNGELGVLWTNSYLEFTFGYIDTDKARL